jgi:hypothetical protein
VNVVTPVLNARVPGWLMPVAGELAVVAPVIVHVRRVTAQLSDVTASGTDIDAVHEPGSVLRLMFAVQVTTGGWFSVTVTVKLHVAELPDASRTV